MEQVRAATMADRQQIKALWNERFGDSRSFTDWFFSERYYPELASCLERDGRILSALQSCPLHLRVRGRIIPASMLTGVSTLTGYEGRGYMSRIFRHYMLGVRARGIPVSINTPAKLDTYFSKGHYPCTDSMYLSISPAPAPELPEGIYGQQMDGECSGLQACYQRAFSGYSGAVSRSVADQAFKLRDYASDGARCFTLRRDGELRGYCVYFPREDEFCGEELAALDAEAYKTLLTGLRHYACGRAVSAKLPPMRGFSYPGAALEIRPQGVMGAADVGALLAALLGDGSLRFEVTDSLLPQNGGLWNGAGERSEGKAHFTLEAGRLCQLLCGYAGVDALAAKGHIGVHDSGAARQLGALLPELECYIVDAY